MTSGNLPGPPPWRVAVALAVVAGLTAALVLVTWRPTAEEQATAEPSTAAPSPTATPPPAPSDLAPQPEALRSDLGAALSAWGEFAVSGDLALLDPHFAAAGPQLAQLATEAGTIAAGPPGPPPYLFEVTDYGGVAVDGGVAEVVASIRLTRPGEEEATFRWRIELRWDPAASRWQLWTVTSLDG